MRRWSAPIRALTLAAAVRVAPTEVISWMVARGPADAMGGARGLCPFELGALGEELAARYLRSQGMHLVGRNLATAEAELDIVGIEGRTLVVVEVKTGWWPASDPGASPGEWTRKRPGARVTEQALARRASAARRLARGKGLSGGRVDVVEVITGRGPRAVLVHHQRLSRGSLPLSGSLPDLCCGLPTADVREKKARPAPCVQDGPTTAAPGRGCE